MGWAKYAEDNLEKMFERWYLSENRKQENKIACTKNLSSTKTAINNACNQIESAESKPLLFKNKHIACKDCGRTFLFSAQAQKQFASQGWDNPKRCKKCRNFNNTRYLMCVFF